MIGIYKIQNLVNGKVYISQSVNIKQRWLSHKEVLFLPSHQYQLKKPLYKDMQLYGLENFSFEVIEQCSRNELNDKQIYWIKEYNSFFFDENSNGYNLTRGGEQSCNSCTEQEIRIMINMWNNGHTVGEIQEATNRGRECILSYLKVYTNYTPTISNQRKNKRLTHGEKSINQYDLNGIFIKNYPSIVAAAKEMHCDPGLISKAVNGRFKQYKGHIYIDAKQNQAEVLARRLDQSRKKQKIAQIDIESNQIIKIFNSGMQAEQAIAGPHHDGTMIKACCRGQYKSIYGYKWRYVND